MNAIMDLTARATSFITAIQTTLLRGAVVMGEERENFSILSIDPLNFRKVFADCMTAEQRKSEGREITDGSGITFSERAIEFFWISKRDSNDEAIKKACTDCAVNVAEKLVDWIDLIRKTEIDKMESPYGGYPTPFWWRETISGIAYSHPAERVKLARALEYLPVQIVLALGGDKFDAYHQRVLQVWMDIDTSAPGLLNEQERSWLREFGWKDIHGNTADSLLGNSDKLLQALVKERVPLSFEHVFSAELTEIEASRKIRLYEEAVALPGEVSVIEGTYTKPPEDPYKRAEQMGGLTGLAFSGGGIRSATFNLGILQGMAQVNLIRKFDYLSTVSGGGYIGSWLAAWIKREGSLVKVTNRLCPDKSPAPAGEELRPVKWLRMYSNYFSPNASIMSADAWTVGITWLRNTMLNQVIILLFLLSLFFLGNELFIWWKVLAAASFNYSFLSVVAWSTGALLPVAFFAGLGMHAYNSQQLSVLGFRRDHTIVISRTIMGLSLFWAYLISAWLCSGWKYEAGTVPNFTGKLLILLPAAIVNFVALLLVAIMGRYGGFMRTLLAQTDKSQQGRIQRMIVLTALSTGALSLICFAGIWELLQSIKIQKGDFKDYNSEIKFIIAFPLVLEVFSITLVARMAFLGRYFPDERREWWGRMGALIHRTSFLWIVVGAAALLGQHFIYAMFDKSALAGTLASGGWAAVILAAVKAAFSKITSEKLTSGKTVSLYANILAVSGPYLFALGLLVFLPGLIKPVYDFVYFVFTRHTEAYTMFNGWYILWITLGLFGLASLLSMRVGVNEFSMHHFYRNRLIRAYLGATRRNSDRKQTANPFTNFDMRDDEKLSSMTSENGYSGPYPILNAALNASEVTNLDRQDRKAESFIFSPLYCGFDFSMLKASDDSRSKPYDYAFRETKDYAFKNGGPSLGTAMAISGAAVNPNQGYHSSAATAFLLTVFNVQMGWWMGNPRKGSWQRSEPEYGLGYIFYNLIGSTNTRSNYVALSDGGHFDNMGLYELIRRKCTTIVVCDAEQDEQFTCEGFANAVRKCRIDFGADIDIDISKIVDRDSDGFSPNHWATGTISYAGGLHGKILYIKSSIVRQCQPVDVYEYAKKHKTFPQQTTADQFFDEEQFESYRKLGLWIAGKVFT